MEIIAKDGRSLCQYTMTYGRLNLSGALTAFPLECEYVRFKSSSNNGAILIYVGGPEVTVADNGYELAAGNEITIGFGLGDYHAANTIYFRATGDAVLFYIAYN